MSRRPSPLDLVREEGLDSPIPTPRRSARLFARTQGLLSGDMASNPGGTGFPSDGPSNTATTTPAPDSRAGSAIPSSTAATTPAPDSRAGSAIPSSTAATTPAPDSRAGSALPSNTAARTSAPDMRARSAIPSNAAATTPAPDSRAGSAIPSNAAATTPAPDRAGSAIPSNAAARTSAPDMRARSAIPSNAAATTPAPDRAGSAIPSNAAATTPAPDSRAGSAIPSNAAATTPAPDSRAGSAIPSNAAASDRAGSAIPSNAAATTPAPDSRAGSALPSNTATTSAPDRRAIPSNVAATTAVPDSRAANASSRSGSLGRPDRPSNSATPTPPRNTHDCRICLQTLRAGQAVQYCLACGFPFHDICIGQWADDLGAPRRCPLCRSPRGYSDSTLYEGSADLESYGDPMSVDTDLRSGSSTPRPPRNPRGGVLPPPTNRNRRGGAPLLLRRNIAVVPRVSHPRTTGQPSGEPESRVPIRPGYTADGRRVLYARKARAVVENEDGSLCLLSSAEVGTSVIAAALPVVSPIETDGWRELKENWGNLGECYIAWAVPATWNPYSQVLPEIVCCVVHHLGGQHTEKVGSRSNVHKLFGKRQADYMIARSLCDEESFATPEEALEWMYEVSREERVQHWLENPRLPRSARRGSPRLWS
ncbi:hypothetical protein ACJ73_03095 [Blastomyces percursus]|uniref:RING-type domain-containing protein n=1 Tax=Blastomyces percursus TaxID=1658174 RepID=A0A1J9Q9P9_9EURO|nr:hypothetical protein ACJ73_03095 [Blastomyces percursus]